MYKEINNLKLIVGKKDLDAKPLVSFNSLACSFLNELSRVLIKDKKAKKFSDIISFAFWCRESNIKILKEKFYDNNLRVGLGLVFHITPSNVPVNFAFSFAFGLLTGNANLIKLPTQKFPQIDIICKKISLVLKKKKFKKLKEMNCFLKYDSKNSNLTKEFSHIADCRMIWGGDKTIKEVKQFETKNKVVDISFGDKYSFCVIDSKSINKISNKKMNLLAERFYNDTYAMDQNACSSPRLIVWLGSKTNAIRAQKRFWPKLYNYAKIKYKLDEINAVDKYEQLCSDAIDLKNIDKLNLNKNLLHRIVLKKLPINLDRLKGKFGYFYEFNTLNINSCKKIINSNFQTLTYYGVNKKTLSDFVTCNRLSGIDRIVPIGMALDIGFLWDGYNLDKSLTRVIELK